MRYEWVASFYTSFRDRSFLLLSGRRVSILYVGLPLNVLLRNLYSVRSRLGLLRHLRKYPFVGGIVSPSWRLFGLVFRGGLWVPLLVWVVRCIVTHNFLHCLNQSSSGLHRR